MAASSPRWLVQLHRFFVLYLTRIVYTLVRGRGRPVPAVGAADAAILKCSATQLALKIRRREVSIETALLPMVTNAT